jgi:peptidoglycan-associated lipoprotein
MRYLLRLFVFGLLAFICMGASRCKKKAPSDTDTQAALGDGFGDPSRPDGLGADDGDVDLPPLIEDPADGLLVERGDLGGFTDPSRDQFEPVYFGFDQSSLSGDERNKVERVAGFLMSNTNASIIIEGHCDWKGTTEYNISLGERRATVVKQFLMAMGIQANRISVNSQGDLLSTENGASASMAKDRKARFIVIKG